jgi:hypothetical protein
MSFDIGEACGEGDTPIFEYEGGLGGAASSGQGRGTPPRQARHWTHEAWITAESKRAGVRVLITDPIRCERIAGPVDETPRGDRRITPGDLEVRGAAAVG